MDRDDKQILFMAC